MKLKALITIIIISSSIHLSAQNKYEIGGQIFDEMAMPVPFANVGFFLAGETVPVGGCASDFDGFFKFDLEPGLYNIQISFIGYKTFHLDSVQVSTDATLPSIQIEPDAQKLKNVVIQSERPTIQTTPGVKTYNVTETAASESSNALDVLKNIPSANVDADDQITMRGRKVTIMIDGVETNIENILEQIPADQIESIDVINNPSAKYDTQNGEGVLNIKLKKSKKTGFSAYTGMRIGNDGMYNPSAGGSYTKGKFSVSGGANLNWNIFKDNGSSYRTSYRVTDTLVSGLDTTYIREPNSFQDQDFASHDDQFKQNYRLKGRYQLNDQSNVELNLNGGLGSYDKLREYHQDFFSKDTVLTRMSDRERKGTYDSYWYKVSAQYKWKEYEGHEFRARVDFYEGDRQDNYTFLDSLFTAEGEFNRVNRLDLIEDGNNEKNFRSKIDYEKPLSGGHSYEIGASMSLRSVIRDYQYSRIDRDDMITWLKDTARSNVYDYDDQNYSVYVLVKGPTVFVDKLTYSAGLRFNTALLSPKSRTDTVDNSSDHYYWSPSFQLAYEINDSQTLSFNYSTKTKLPSYYRLNPFITYYGPTRVFYGNAQLKPEEINTFDLSYDISLLDDKLFLGASTYYKSISNITIRYRFDSEDEDGNSIVNQTFRNVNSGETYGFEIIETWKVIKPLKIKSSFNWYTATFATFSETYNRIVTRNGTNYNFKTSTDLEINKKLSTQLSFNYFSTRVTAQGYYEPNYFMNFSARQKLLKDDRLSLSFRWTDVLQSWNRDRVVDQEDSYSSTSEYSRNQSRYSITARYSINKMKFS
ncbi:TonB-dependent receptor domain-containing protein [Reichenbachiella versicolor]|uniref:TonB-dependent receptor domain-containing protein n=1 Tax=Reichenbachiella versicolor TaxID=1821036 RepID=UPI000D6E4B22|nr:TonB-dependent receptor [Reichenbachiella versicolor]